MKPLALLSGLLIALLLSSCAQVAATTQGMAVAVDMYCAQPEVRRVFLRMEFNRAIAPHQLQLHCVDPTPGPAAGLPGGLDMDVSR